MEAPKLNEHPVVLILASFLLGVIAVYFLSPLHPDPAHEHPSIQADSQSEPTCAAYQVDPGTSRIAKKEC